MKIIAIAGGSGAGKSTLAYALVDAKPEQFEVINLDDYQKLDRKAEVPTLNGTRNWDHPEAIDWEKLRSDLQALRRNETIRLDTWAHRSNPNFRVHQQKIRRLIKPHPVTIVEGYLALYQTMAGMYNQTFYLDLDEPTRLERRRQARGSSDKLSGNPRYNDLILRPMFERYVKPTKHNADVVIEVDSKTTSELVDLITKHLE